MIINKFHSDIKRIFRSSYPGIKDEALFGSHVGRIGTRVGETFAAVGALKGLFAAVNPDVLLFQP